MLILVSALAHAQAEPVPGPVPGCFLPAEKCIAVAQHISRVEARNEYLEKENAELVVKQDNATLTIILTAVAVGLAVGVAGTSAVVLWHPWQK